MHLCSNCTQRTARQFCRCVDPPVKLCEECVSKHQYSSHMRKHELFPIETFPYIEIPGYADGFIARTGKQREQAVEELRSNLELLEQWKNDLKAMHQTLAARLSEHWEKQEREFASLHSSLKTAIQAGVAEADSTSVEPSPHLQTAIARGIRQFRPGMFRLLSTPTAVLTLQRNFTAMVNTAFVIEMKPIEGEFASPIPDSRTVVVVEKTDDSRAIAEGKRSAKESQMPAIRVIRPRYPQWPKPNEAEIAIYISKKKAIFLVSAMICLVGIFLFGVPDSSCSVMCNQWISDSKQVFGKVAQPNKYMYEGTWRCGSRDGIGVEQYEARKTGNELVDSVYIGGFRNNQRYGIGVLFENKVPTYFGFWGGKSLIDTSPWADYPSFANINSCKSFKEHKARFIARDAEPAIYSVLENWAFRSSRALHLVGISFTSGPLGAQLKLLKIFERELVAKNLVYTHEKGRRSSRNEEYQIDLSSAIIIEANTTYFIESEFDNYSGRQEVLPEQEIDGVWFSIKEGSGLQLPRLFRGFSFYTFCEDSVER